MGVTMLPYRTILSGSLLLAIIVCGPLLAQEPKLPIPSDSAQAEALKLA